MNNVHKNRVYVYCVTYGKWEPLLFIKDCLLISEFIIIFSDFISRTDVPSRFCQMNPN